MMVRWVLACWGYVHECACVPYQPTYKLNYANQNQEGGKKSEINGKK